MTYTWYQCTEGCTRQTKDGTPLGPRVLSPAEVAAHDDKHVSDSARVLVRMLREVSPAVREEVLAYFTWPSPRYAIGMREPADG